jgi:hypothetical protein
VEFTLIEHEIEEIDTLISEVLKSLNWNSDSESFQLLYLKQKKIFSNVRISQLLTVTDLQMVSLLN